MALDGIFFAAIREELNSWLESRVDRIYQPEKETIIIHLRKGRETKRLLLCSLPDQARVHLTTASFTNPLNPPLFCMVLRKHIEGAILTKIEQPGLERVLKFQFDSTDELGRPAQRILIIEIMGKHSNIILINLEGEIIDATRRYTHAVSRHREVLPGRPYVPPPVQVKIDPRTLNDETMAGALLEEGSLHIPLERLLVEKIEGIGPETAREILYRAGILKYKTTPESLGLYELTRIWQSLHEILKTCEPSGWHPSVVLNNEQKPLAFAAHELLQFEGLDREFFNGPSAACDSFFIARREAQIQEGIRRKIEHVLNRELKRCYKKESLQSATINEAREAETWRLAGELLTANIYRVEKGQDRLTVPNYYDPDGKPVVIELDPALTPAQNAQKYFNRYNKAKNATHQARKQLEQTRNEITYLKSIAQSLDMAEGMDDLVEIQKELRQAGYLPVSKEKQKPAKKPGKKEKLQRLEPLEFTSPDGFKILVGKNNRQNDWLTLKQATPEDIWFHAKDIPGSHVVIRTEGREVPDATLEMAARLAARYSHAHQSSRVPVDYTLVKHVRKPTGAKPGMVIYDHQRTLYVAPWSIPR